MDEERDQHEGWSRRELLQVGAAGAAALTAAVGRRALAATTPEASAFDRALASMDPASRQMAQRGKYAHHGKNYA